MFSFSYNEYWYFITCKTLKPLKYLYIPIISPIFHQMSKKRVHRLTNMELLELNLTLYTPYF